MENKVLIDWLSLTSKSIDIWGFQELLGMSECPWEDTKGAKGYKSRKYFNGISIHYDGRDDMGVWLEMSGQGCRAFESVGTGNFQALFDLILSGVCHVTRLDIAYDDLSGVLDMQTMIADASRGEFVCKARKGNVEKSLFDDGACIYFGSMKSDILIRIYNKAAERHCEPGVHWVRVEMQLRDDRAFKYLSLPGSAGDRFCGVLVNYLRFVDEDPADSNRWRWPLKDYWGELLCGAAALSIYDKPGMEYNIDRCAHYVFNQAGGAIDAMIQILGPGGFMTQLRERKPKIPNPKYKALVEAYKAYSL